MGFGNLTLGALGAFFNPAVVATFGGAALDQPLDYGPFKFRPGLITGDTDLQYAGLEMAQAKAELVDAQVSNIAATYSETVTMVTWALAARLSKELLESTRGGVITRNAAAEIAKISTALWESLVWRVAYEVGRFFGRTEVDLCPDGQAWFSANHPSAPGVGVRDNLGATSTPSIDAVRDELIALATRKDYMGRNMGLRPGPGNPVEIWTTPDGYWTIMELLGPYLAPATFSDGRLGSQMQTNAYMPAISRVAVVPESQDYHLMVLAHPKHGVSYCEQWAPMLETTEYEAQKLGILYVGNCRFDLLGGPWEYLQGHPLT